MRPLAPSLFIAFLLASPAWAQNAGKPLNLKLPPSDLPPAASTAPRPASAPGVYYGDTSGRTAADDESTLPACDEATYEQPQVHGSVGMGVAGGSRVEGSYQRGTVNISKAFGSCEHPGGGVSVSIGAGSGHFHERGH